MTQIFYKKLMFTVIQSNDTDILVNKLSQFYQDHPTGVFDEFVVITPARVLDDWLKKTIAKKMGISTLVTSQFWGQYQWQMIKDVLDRDNALNTHQKPLKVPEVAVLSQSVIRWQIFSYLSSANEQKALKIAYDDTHALHHLIKPLIDNKSNSNAKDTISTKKLWQLSHNLARVFVLYLTQRDDWLSIWSNNKHIDTDKLLKDKQKFEDIYQKFAHDNNFDSQQKDEPEQIPDWLFEHYKNLEIALQFLWHKLFAGVYDYRKQLEARFWSCLQKDNFDTDFKDILPKNLYLFTILQMPKIELDFLQKLSGYMDIYLLHFNPSMMFWADIVDKTWLMQQQVINADSVYLKDYGHGLLSRLGKASRESFAMLASLSGGEDFDDHKIDWQDAFNELKNTPNTLLNYLKKDILQLEENRVAKQVTKINENTLAQIKHKKYSPKHYESPQDIIQDTSIMVHSCHNLKRQLEILRLYIAKWLNQKNADGSQRHLSDIVVFLPNIEDNAGLIQAVFPQGFGIDGLNLPAKITGVGNKLAQELFLAISGFYTLSQDMLFAHDFFEWLLIPSLYQSIGLSIDEVYRATELLKTAGFVKGLNEHQLKQTLHNTDTDYRHTLSSAIDKLVASMIYGNGESLSSNNTTYFSKIFYPFDNKKTPCISLNNDDHYIIQKLCLLYQTICHHQSDFNKSKPVEQWLISIENDIIKVFFDEYQDADVLRSIFDVMNAMKSAIKANYFYEKDNQKSFDIYLTLGFVLESIGESVKSQQVSSEPTGAITFGRFGSLRNINFGLVVMLDMNMGVFPRRETVNGLDLTKGFLRRRGDTVGEDDDNGAFLDAMLCAKDACWIFYTGQAINSDVPLLPASPVVELLRYFKEFVWQATGDDVFEEAFIIKHSALPFSDDNFYLTDNIQNSHQKQLPPAKIWQMVNDAINDKSKKTIHKTIVYSDDYDYLTNVLENTDYIDTVPNAIYITDIIKSVQKQAIYYLKDKVSITDIQQDTTHQAPLALDSLKNYEAYELLLNSDDINPAYKAHKNVDDIINFDDLMPVGAMKSVAFDDVKNTFLQSKENFLNNLKNIGIDNYQPTQFNNDTTTITITTKGGQMTVKVFAQLPDIDSVCHNNNTAVYIKPNKISYKYQIQIFLTHLVWQSSVDSQSFKTFCQFKDDFIVFDGIPKDTANNILKKWVLFYCLSKTYITAVTPSNLYQSLSSEEDLFKQFATWFAAIPYNGFVDGENIHDIYWQYVINDNGSQLLKLSLPIIKLLAQDLVTYDITSEYK